MKIIISTFALLGAVWAFPKNAEEPQFKRLYVDPLHPISEQLIPRIVNGHEVVPHSIPYQAYLIFTGEEGRWLCGGSLISAKNVLTAGHCVDGASSVDVYLGAHNLQIVEATRIHVTSSNLRLHEHYNGDKINNDIGLIELSTPVELNENVNIVSLPRLVQIQTYEGKSARVSGWGLTKGDGKTSPVLMEVNSTVIANTLCNLYYGIVEDYEVCISGSGGVGSCNGDSGGPLVVDNEQIGIVSYGAKGCLSGYPSAFTRVTSFLDWLEKHTDLKF